MFTIKDALESIFNEDTVKTIVDDVLKEQITSMFWCMGAHFQFTMGFDAYLKLVKDDVYYLNNRIEAKAKERASKEADDFKKQVILACYRYLYSTAVPIGFPLNEKATSNYAFSTKLPVPTPGFTLSGLKDVFTTKNIWNMVPLVLFGAKKLDYMEVRLKEGDNYLVIATAGGLVVSQHFMPVAKSYVALPTVEPVDAESGQPRPLAIVEISSEKTALSAAKAKLTVVPQVTAETPKKPADVIPLKPTRVVMPS